MQKDLYEIKKKIVSGYEEQSESFENEKELFDTVQIIYTKVIENYLNHNSIINQDNIEMLAALGLAGIDFFIFKFGKEKSFDFFSSRIHWFNVDKEYTDKECFYLLNKYYNKLTDSYLSNSFKLSYRDIVEFFNAYTFLLNKNGFIDLNKKLDKTSIL